MPMCDWRNGERTYMAHVRHCYPRSTAFLVFMSLLIFATLVLDIMGAFDA